MQNGLAPHSGVMDKNLGGSPLRSEEWADTLSGQLHNTSKYHPTTSHARPPTHRVPVPQGKVPITFGCKNQWWLCLNETQRSKVPGISLKGPRHGLTCSELHTGAAAQKIPKTYSIKVRAEGAAFSQREELAEAIFPFLSHPPTEPLGGHHTNLDNSVHPALLIPWDPLSTCFQWLYIQIACLGSCFRLS